MALLVLFVALSLSAIAAYYSIVGLAAIFASAIIPIVVMGSVLEVAKLTVTVWLHQNWQRASYIMKFYMVPAVLVLMFITSMGIFGFLSKAHIEQTSAAEEQAAQLVRMDEEIIRQQDIIARAEARIAKGETDADKQDLGIQSKIDREQERINSAYTRRQPSIDEQQAIITAQENTLLNRVAVYEDEIISLDTELSRLNNVVSNFRNSLEGASVASVEQQIQPYLEQITQLDVDLATLNNQVVDYEARIGKLVPDLSALSTLKEQISVLETRIAELTPDYSAVNTLQEQISAVEQQIILVTNKLQSTERAKIQEGQAVIGVTSDGLFGGNTRRALASWVESQRSRIAELQGQETSFKEQAQTVVATERERLSELINNLQEQSSEIRNAAQANVEAERDRLTKLVNNIRGSQIESVQQRKQALLDTIDRIRTDAVAGLESQRSSIQEKIDNVLNVEIPDNRVARKTAQDTITELRNKEDPRIEIARAEISRIRAVAEEEIANSQAVIERLRAQIQVGDDVDLDTLIDEQQERIRVANSEIDFIIENKFALESEVRKLEAEVGPIKYIAQLIYGEDTNSNVLESAVRWVIILIVFVFDPLAIMMLLAATETFSWRQKDRLTALPVVNEIPKENTANEEIQTANTVPEDSIKIQRKDESQKDTKETSHSGNSAVQIESVRGETGENRDEGDSLDQSPKKIAVHVERIVFPEYKEEEVELKFEDVSADELAEEERKDYEAARAQLVADNVPPTIEFELPTPPPLPDEAIAGYKAADYEDERTDDIIVVEGDDDEKQAKRIWKRLNPDLTLKEQEQKFSQKQIDVLPWAQYLELSDNEIETNYTTVEFGTVFPDRAVKGDIYIRVDYLPTKVFKWNGTTWIEIDKNNSDTYAYNDEYIKHLIEKLGSGEYDPELLNDVERSQLEQQLRDQGI